MDVQISYMAVNIQGWNGIINIEMKKGQPITMFIKNKRDSCSIKVCSPFELSCKQKNYCFGIAYFSCT